MSRAPILVLILAIRGTAAQFSAFIPPDKTTVSWTLGDVLHTVHGTFALKSGQIDFDTQTGAASGQVIVDVTSGATGSSARDHRMHANVLESAKYSDAVFTADRIEGKLSVPGSSTVQLHGLFKIHGTAHEITLKVQAISTDSRMNATIAFDVPYVAWGMKDPSTFLLKVSKSVQCSIQTSAILTKK